MWVSILFYMVILKKKIVLSDVRNNKILVIIVFIFLWSIVFLVINFIKDELVDGFVIWFIIG